MKRYDPKTIERVQTLIEKGLTNRQISQKTKVLPFTVQYYRTKKRSNVTPVVLLQRKLTKAIKSLQLLQTSLQ